MIGAVKPSLLAGGSVVILPGFDAAEVVRSIERYRITYLTGVLAMYKMMLDELESLASGPRTESSATRPPAVSSVPDVSSVRYALCGSAEVSAELLDRFREVFGAEIAESYGLTEGGPVPVVNQRRAPKRRGSCGRAFEGCEVKIVGEDGVTDVGVDQTGELITRNPGVTPGYWKLPDITAQTIRDGWLHTGDLMRRDGDGFFYFVGRQDDMINVAGENVYPKEVEDILLRHPAVTEVCVVSVPHGLKGRVPVAIVVPASRPDVEHDSCADLSQSAALDSAAILVAEQELKEFYLRHGAAYGHPRRVLFVDALPLGGTGKPDRAAMQKMAEREAGAPV